MMNRASIAAYEKQARRYLHCRDCSRIGIQVARRWAHSLDTGAEVIEIACGGGLPVTQVLQDAGLKLWAVDPSPTLLACFRARFPQIPTQLADVLACDYFRREFDGAIAIGLIFLLRETDQSRMITRIGEILRPGASFLFTAPLEAGGWTDAITGHACLSLGQEVYEKLLHQSGFRVLRRHQDSGGNNYYEAVIIDS
ncbi:class I SAM-dependent methyltransferase [Sedimenticola thiotaurini]|nr:class I SAM-dependent methyltransferase [Sedimenticola thiotaurini]